MARRGLWASSRYACRLHDRRAGSTWIEPPIREMLRAHWVAGRNTWRRCRVGLGPRDRHQVSCARMRMRMRPVLDDSEGLRDADGARSQRGRERRERGTGRLLHGAGLVLGPWCMAAFQYGNAQWWFRFKVPWTSRSVSYEVCTMLRQRVMTYVIYAQSMRGVCGAMRSTSSSRVGYGIPIRYA